MLLPACLSFAMRTEVFHMEREDEKKKRIRKDGRRSGKVEMERFHLIFYSSTVCVFAEDSNDDLPPLLDRCGID